LAAWEDAVIIDTNKSCIGKTAFLKGKGVTTVGRYYRLRRYPEWAITKPEAQELSREGIKIFIVFEEYGKKSDLPLTKARGKEDGQIALDQARGIGQPEGTAIYFAVEGLPHGYKSSDLPGIRRYFSGIQEIIGARYPLGAYGDGIVCKTLLDEGICKFTWLAAASCSFEGTCDFFAKGRWSLAQLPPLDLEDGWNGLSVDINHKNPRIADFGTFSIPLA
jgi:hypothetical protein